MTIPGDIPWCCSIFQGWFEQAGNRGPAVIAESYSDGAAGFKLQFRSAELGDDGPKDHPRPLTLISDLGIHFCPWCGADLGKFYGQGISRLVRPELHQPDASET